MIKILNEIINFENIMSWFFNGLHQVYETAAPQLCEMIGNIIAVDIVGTIIIIIVGLAGISLGKKARDIIFNILGLF